MVMDLTSSIRNSKAGEDVVYINMYTIRVSIVVASISDINVPLCFFKLKLAALAYCDVSFVLSIHLAEKYSSCQLNRQLLWLSFS